MEKVNPHLIKHVRFVLKLLMSALGTPILEEDREVPGHVPLLPGPISHICEPFKVAEKEENKGDPVYVPSHLRGVMWPSGGRGARGGCAQYAHCPPICWLQ